MTCAKDKTIDKSSLDVQLSNWRWKSLRHGRRADQGIPSLELEEFGDTNATVRKVCTDSCSADAIVVCCLRRTLWYRRLPVLEPEEGEEKKKNGLQPKKQYAYQLINTNRRGICRKGASIN